MADKALPRHHRLRRTGGHAVIDAERASGIAEEIAARAVILADGDLALTLSACAKALLATMLMAGYTDEWISAAFDALKRDAALSRNAIGATRQ